MVILTEIVKEGEEWTEMGRNKEGGKSKKD